VRGKGAREHGRSERGEGKREKNALFFFNLVPRLRLGTLSRRLCLLLMRFGLKPYYKLWAKALLQTLG
jgi:hypothetical protein